jgi:RNA polymerase sigma-70 factor, ECF subfamily
LFLNQEIAMLEDKILIWKFNRGSQDALRRIYENYKNDLFSLAAAILNDTHAAEDVVHDVFVGFTKTAGMFRLSGSLKGYLMTCVANLARNVRRRRQRETVPDMPDQELIIPDPNQPEQPLIDREQSQRLQDGLIRLPDEQREVIIMHMQYGLCFRDIARSQNISIHTVQSRYRYGLTKLRTLLDGTLEL